ncbi:MAG: hypothetical protein ACP5N3_03550 [Candidatus Nanoarchaeia archaeon]
MNFKAFYPRLHNLFPSILITAAWWFFLYLSTRKSCMLVRCMAPENCGFNFIQLLPKCCGCADFTSFLNQLLLISIPLVVVYVIASVIKMTSSQKDEEEKK